MYANFSNKKTQENLNLNVDANVLVVHHLNTAKCLSITLTLEAAYQEEKRQT